MIWNIFITFLATHLQVLLKWLSGEWVYRAPSALEGVTGPRMLAWCIFSQKYVLSSNAKAFFIRDKHCHQTNCYGWWGFKQRFNIFITLHGNKILLKKHKLPLERAPNPSTTQPNKNTSSQLELVKAMLATRRISWKGWDKEKTSAR